MKKILPVWIIGLTLLGAVGGFLVLQGIMSYSATAAPLGQTQEPTAQPPLPGWIVPTATPVDLSTITDVSKPPLVGGRKPEHAPVFVNSRPMSSASAAGAPTAPTIDVWYGATQRFGLIGHPQPWINILGNVTGTEQIVSLTYSLNGSAAIALHQGADGFRLAQTGDFNVEIPYSALNAGNNVLTLSATDALNNVTTEQVTIQHTTNTVWPLPTQVQWNNVTPLNETVQIVDGEWTIENSQLRPVALGYDRLVTLGDQSWTDYEVSVPLTIKGIDPAGYFGVNNGPNLGIGVRWGGHFDAGNGTQPQTGWQNIGALALYRWQLNSTEVLQMFGYGGATIGANVDKQLTVDTPYLAKLSAQSTLTGTAYYRFKVWPASAPEPLLWDMESYGLAGEPSAGSVVLQAHYADVRFGNISVQPLSAIQPKLTIVPPTNGSITATPLQDSYTYGDRVTLEATPALGYQLASWGDDISSTNSIVDIYMTQDVVASANFVEAPPPTIVYTATDHGSVSWTPDKSQYIYGEQVTFTATPAPGYMLAAWGGNVSGNANPLTIMIDRDLQIAPQFVPAQTPFSDDFNACTLDTTRWTFVDPVGDVTYTSNGTQITINLPATSDHDLWEGKNLAPRFMQTMENTDFDLVTKFETLLTQQYQMEGMIIEQDANNFLRADFYADVNGMHIFAATFVDGVPSTQVNAAIAPPGSELYLRVSRVGNDWTVSYSFDGSAWTTAVTFAYEVTVSKAGFFAANAAGDSSPANTVIVDTFINMSAPITNDDGKSFTLTPQTVGNGTVTRNPDKASYTCGEQITLTAIPGADSLFAGWSGAVTGTSSPIVFNFTPGATITATFTTGQINAKLYLPLAAKP